MLRYDWHGDECDSESSCCSIHAGAPQYPNGSNAEFPLAMHDTREIQAADVGVSNKAYLKTLRNVPIEA